MLLKCFYKKKPSCYYIPKLEKATKFFIGPGLSKKVMRQNQLINSFVYLFTNYENDKFYHKIRLIVVKEVWNELYLHDPGVLSYHNDPKYRGIVLKQTV